jgi:hypothetical protein
MPSGPSRPFSCSPNEIAAGIALAATGWRLVFEDNVNRSGRRSRRGNPKTWEKNVNREGREQKPHEQRRERRDRSGWNLTPEGISDPLANVQAWNAVHGF